jgi:hypothetical protein
MMDVTVGGDAPEVLNQPMLHLKYLTLTFNQIQQSSILSSLSRRQGWTPPSFTHLSFHFYGLKHRDAVMNVANVFGKQLEFFALTGFGQEDTSKSWFCEMLAVAPNTKYFAFYPQLNDNIRFNQLPYTKCSNIVEVVGILNVWRDKSSRTFLRPLDSVCKHFRFSGTFG